MWLDILLREATRPNALALQVRMKIWLLKAYQDDSISLEKISPDHFLAVRVAAVVEAPSAASKLEGEKMRFCDDAGR